MSDENHSDSHGQTTREDHSDSHGQTTREDHSDSHGRTTREDHSDSRGQATREHQSDSLGQTTRDESQSEARARTTSNLNRESYNAIASSWDGARRVFVQREDAYLDALLEGLPDGASILDLGCGTGRPIAEHILAKGYRVTGVDQADRLLELARLRFPDATWIVSSIEEFETPEKFSAIVFWDALFHIERDKHQSLLEKCAAMLEPGGRIMLTVGGSLQPEGFTDTMFGETFFYDSHAPATLLALLSWAGFEPIIAEFMNRPDGDRDKGRFAIVARRR